jgi:hypothetical protein
MTTASASLKSLRRRREEERGGQRHDGRAGALRKQLDGDGDDLLREMVAEFARRLIAAEVDALTGAGWGEVSPERLNHRTPTAAALRHPGRQRRSGDPEAAAGKLRPGPAPRPPPPGGEGARGGGGRVLCPRGQHPPGRWACERLGRRVALEDPGEPHGRRARRDGLRVPQPAPGRGAPHIRF